MKPIFFAVILSFCLMLSACVSNPPILVPDSQGSESISAIALTCSNPYELKYDCSWYSGATKEVVILDAEFKIAGTEDGKTVLIMGDEGRRSRGESSNLAYELVKRELSKHGIAILKISPVVSSNILFGYLLETDKPAYALLSDFAKN